MSERISALMDGELDQSEWGYNLKRLAADGKLRSAWDTYHLIGDALRGDLGPAYADKVAARLADEPTVLAPRRRRRSVHRARWLAMSVAASAAAVALVAWMSLPQSGPQQPLVASVPASKVQAQPQAIPAPAGVDDYLLAHQRFSPSGAMQGVATYVRTVADEGRR